MMLFNKDDKEKKNTFWKISFAEHLTSFDKMPFHAIQDFGIIQIIRFKYDELNNILFDFS